MEVGSCDAGGSRGLESDVSTSGRDVLNTRITDAGLEHLKGMTNFARLNLEGSQITLEGVKKLQEALPECEIVY